MASKKRRRYPRDRLMKDKLAAIEKRLGFLPSKLSLPETTHGGSLAGMLRRLGPGSWENALMQPRMSTPPTSPPVDRIDPFGLAVKEAEKALPREEGHPPFYRYGPHYQEPYRALPGWRGNDYIPKDEGGFAIPGVGSREDINFKPEQMVNAALEYNGMRPRSKTPMSAYPDKKNKWALGQMRIDDMKARNANLQAQAHIMNDLSVPREVERQLSPADQLRNRIQNAQGTMAALNSPFARTQHQNRMGQLHAIEEAGRRARLGVDNSSVNAPEEVARRVLAAGLGKPKDTSQLQTITPSHGVSYSREAPRPVAAGTPLAGYEPPHRPPATRSLTPKQVRTTVEGPGAQIVRKPSYQPDLSTRSRFPADMMKARMEEAATRAAIKAARTADTPAHSAAFNTIGPGGTFDRAADAGNWRPSNTTAADRSLSPMMDYRPASRVVDNNLSTAKTMAALGGAAAANRAAVSPKGNRDLASEEFIRSVRLNEDIARQKAQDPGPMVAVPKSPPITARPVQTTTITPAKSPPAPTTPPVYDPMYWRPPLPSSIATGPVPTVPPASAITVPQSPLAATPPELIAPEEYYEGPIPPQPGMFSDPGVVHAGQRMIDGGSVNDLLRMGGRPDTIRYSPANFNERQGGSKYSYSTATTRDGRTVTSYTNSRGRNISFSNERNGRIGMGGVRPGGLSRAGSDR